MSGREWVSEGLQKADGIYARAVGGMRGIARRRMRMQRGMCEVLWRGIQEAIAEA